MWCGDRICSGQRRCTGRLQALLALPAPRYRHHPLVHGADGRKLAKSMQATAFRPRAQGVTPHDIRRRGRLPGMMLRRRLIRR